MNMDTKYRIAIPTYKRSKELFKLTLPLLTEGNIKPEAVFIFLNSDDDADAYTKIAVGTVWETANWIITPTEGIGKKRNFMKSFFRDLSIKSEEKVNVLFIDDDISALKQLDNKKLIPTTIDFVIQKGFSACEKEGLNVWGISHLSNPLFMKNKVSTSLKYIQGGFQGEIFDGDKELVQINIDQLEDFDFTCGYFLRDGGVARLEEFCLKTRAFREGGLVSFYGGRKLRIESSSSSADILKKKYGDMLKIVDTKYGKDIRLNWRWTKEKEEKNIKLFGDRLICYIPSTKRSSLTNFTLFGAKPKLNELPFKVVLTVPEEEVKEYEANGYGIPVLGVPQEFKGIGKTRDYILNHLTEFGYEYILMIDDDIKKIRKYEEDLNTEEILTLIENMMDTLESRNAYLGGFTLCNNSFYMKSSISNTLKYISGAFQLHRVSDRTPIRTDYRHFEDYVCNMEYFKRDGIICRWNYITPITKNYDEVGGICSDYGSLEARLKDAEVIADTIISNYPDKWVKKVYKKKSARCPACWNLQLNYRAKSEEVE